jgi:hypothetical protein
MKGFPKRGAFVGGRGIFFFGLLISAFCVIALYGIWAFWPSENTKGRGLLPSKTVHYFGWDRKLSRESLFFVTVAFSGALGGMVHSIRSLVVYMGNRRLRWSWTPFYLLKPVLGAMLATLLYFVLRAGLFSPSASTTQASPYGFAAIGALAGLFSDQAVVKLKSIAEQLFEPTDVTQDHYQEGIPVVTTGDPSNVTSTSATVSGTVDRGGYETTYLFEYGPGTDYGIKTQPKTLDKGTEVLDVTADLQNLSPSTTYRYRLVATNEVGRAIADDEELKTEPA